MENRDVSKHVLIAPAWPYANGSLHLGHIAAFIGADVLARYHRLKGDNVLLVSGSDCYGTPIAIEAIKQGVTPASIADHYHKEFKDTLINKLNFTYDLYTKTTTPEHMELVQDMFVRLYGNDYIYTKVAKALYSPFLDRFLPDRFVEGECPQCGYQHARGDQCDECGTLLDPLMLRYPRVNPKAVGEVTSPSDLKLEVRESEHFYLKLSAFQEKLDSWVERTSGTWRSNAAQFTKSFLNKGLQDRPITRDTDWGVPVPLAGYESKKIYVWFEAVLGYLSASRHYAKERNTPDSWEKWWHNPDAVHYYVHGKDNVLFHTVILPAILLGAGDFHLPDRVFASEFLSLEGKQFSTSRSYGVWVPDFLKHFDSELLRYFVIAQGPETSDIDFRWSEFGRLVNGELIGTFGNLVNRICAFAEKNFPEGVAVSIPEGTQMSAVLDAEANGMLSTAEAAVETVGKNIEMGKFRQAFREILKVAEAGNQFAHIREPWKRIKEDREQTQKDVLVLLHTIRTLAILVQPFLPKTSATIQSFFSSPAITSEAGLKIYSAWRYHPIPSSITVSNTKVLFVKVEEEDIQKQREKLGLE